MITTWIARAAKMTGVQRRRRSEILERLPPASGTVIKLTATTAMRNTVGAHLLQSRLIVSRYIDRPGPRLM